MKPLYRSYNSYLRERFGERVHKISLDAGFTCPNRDGTKAVGGCIYCNNDSFNFSPKIGVAEQLVAGITKAKARYGARKFIAYFQAYTNTYAPVDFLHETYNTIHQFPDVVGLSIGTRPDCVPDQVLDVIQEFTSTHDVWIEYGLESSHDETLRRINRAHTFAEFRDAVMRTAGRSIKIGTHIIIGFPWETEADVYQTATNIAALPINALKMHNLHIVKGTALEKMYERSSFPLITLQEYAEWTSRVLEMLPPDMIVLRLSAECPADLLVAPAWCNDKQEITRRVLEILQMRGSFQGRDFTPALQVS